MRNPINMKIVSFPFNTSNTVELGNYVRAKNLTNFANLYVQ